MNEIAKNILKVNQAFYNAFAAGDYIMIEKIWARTHDVSVIHPGSVVLHGREAVMMSWQQILENSGGSHIQCVDPKVYVFGETAYVVCNEYFPEGQLVATNIFVIEDGNWRMVHHQAGFQNKTNSKLTDTIRQLH